MFYIRVDGNEIIATGHIMRCLSIAKELRKVGVDTTFIIADDRPKELILQCGFNVICLGSVWDDLNGEINCMVKLIKEYDIKFLLIDSYFVTKEYFQSLTKYTMTMYIDDIDSFIYPVNYIINYNIYANNLEYEKRYKEVGYDTKFLLGCKYAPLRDEFWDVNKIIYKNVNKILITTGGTDTYNLAGKLLDKLENYECFKEIEYYVVIGRFNKNAYKLKKQWGSYSNIYLLENVLKMSDYMKQCDIAVTASGSTVYELCACGVPSILFVLADNQLEIAKEISIKGLMNYAGDIREEEDKVIDSIINFINDMRYNCLVRKRMSRKMKEFVDGKGAKRIADILSEIFLI